MKKVFGGFFFFILLGLVSAAEITIPRFEMVTLGRIRDDEFSMASAISVDLALNGGYKYGLSLGFSFDCDNLAKALAYRNFQFGYLDYLDGSRGTPVEPDEYNDLAEQINLINDRLNNRGTLSFRTAKATVRELFSLPLELSFFIGEGDNYCSGDEFPLRFGVDPIGTDYRGLFYFPQGIGGNISRQYYGIHEAGGTGISLALSLWDTVVPMIYIYQSFPSISSIFGYGTSGAYGESLYSGDLRCLLNLEKFKMEAFWGLSYNDGFITRGGILTHFQPINDLEFLFQGGITGWALDDELTIDNFFFLMEPRFRFGIFGINTTLFYHPVIYHNILTVQERGKADINLKMFIQIPNTEFTAGIESTMGLKIDKMEDFSFQAAPFISFLSSGLRWDTKLRVNLTGTTNLKEMFELFIGVNTSF